MTTKQRTWVIAVVVLSIGLMSLGTMCEMTAVIPQEDGTGSGTGDDGGTTTGDDGGTTTGDDGGTTTGDDGDTTTEEPNPNSPCPDQTNIYVSYVNESTARVGFIENFRDQAYQSLSASSLVLQAAGDSGATREKCITCPWQAGLRNIKYIQNGQSTWVQYPPDLFRGDFRCGDNITFVFKDNATVDTLVETP
ncbi:MAG: hypothetical protein JSV03_15145 [Planctomycetota bacterium]|nr:MAG: hypothetical protein JSV03_15145 [Planctomycetota bacterium]